MPKFVPNPATSKIYPHTAQVGDPSAKQSLILLWDRLQTLEANLATFQSTIHSDQIASLQSQIDTLTQQVQQASAPAGIAVTGMDPIGSGTPTTGTPGNDDGGQGDLGCSQSGATGHVTTGAPISPFTAGQICCGTAKEFPALLTPAVDAAARTAQRLELLGRMIWHLNLAGFSSSYYPGNPFDLLIGIGPDQYAYRVIDYAEYPVPIQSVMILGGISKNTPTPADGGIPD